MATLGYKLEMEIGLSPVRQVVANKTWQCDFGVPECQRCFTTGRTCLGYAQDLTFKVTCSTNWPHKPSRRVLVHEEGKKGLDGDMAEMTQCPSEPSAEHEYCTTLRRLCKPLDQTAASCELFTELFLGMFMPVGYDLHNAVMVPGGWVSLFPTLFHGKDDLLTKSLLALYTGFVGRRNRDVRLTCLSIELYANALQLLRESGIWSSKRRQLGLDAKLASIIVFSRCELFASEGGDGGYMAHIRGGLEVVKRFATGLPHSELMKMMVKKFRILGYYASIRHRTGFFMSNPPYNKLYLAETGDCDYIIQKGFESIITMPTIMECADKIDSPDSATKWTVLELQRAIRHLLILTAKIVKSLNSWYFELSNAISAPVPTYTTPPTVEGGNYLCVGQLHYARAGDNYIWILYWVFSLYLNLLIKQLQSRHAKLVQLLAKPVQLPIELAELGLGYEILDEYADNIRKSLFGGCETSAFDAQETMAPVFTLQWYYEQRGDAAKIRWCIDAIRTLEQQGLTLDLQIIDMPSWCPIVRARFLAEVE
ncbi:hypothetical protein N431DRAFT_458767 [Stipitochalara longipes BDJ]|nr:hypothetical protein N431DRAFT_458767 [Stipitochalara longipes BDJ]